MRHTLFHTLSLFLFPTMHPLKSTAEILASKVLGESVDERWIAWALEMLEAEFETEHLLILAGENPPFNQFYLTELTNKVLKELGLEYSNKDKVLDQYISYLIDGVLAGQVNMLKVLRMLKDMHVEHGYQCDSKFQDFYFLYYAKDELEDFDHQFYWDGANRENIDEIILRYFVAWKTQNEHLSSI